MDVRAITQPATGSVIEAISCILEHCQVSRFDIAAAYITTKGVEELIFTLRSGLGDSWPDVEKRWLTSFDYLRTTPLALNAILAAPKSKLRIHNSLVLNNKGCVPSVPFHPKSFIFTGSNARYVLAGSGNVSKSGLTRGHEAGIIVGL